MADIAFGEQFISVPAHSRYFQTTVPMSFNGEDFEVWIEAGINLGIGEVFADFVSIDPFWGLPPSVDVGFLPPEDGTGRGIGRVSYVIRPEPNLPTGAQIRNVAAIRFDVNPVVTTDQADPHDPSKGTDPAKQAIVTIDAEPPSSAVASLPPTVNTPSFLVSWSGIDPGAGIASYDIHTSTNNGAWGIWLASTRNNFAMFTGQNGQTYSFYSIARDYLGNTETPPAAADAVTTVNTLPIVLSITPALLSNGQIDQITLTFPTSPSFDYVVEYRDDLNSDTSWQPLPGAPHNIGTVTETNLVTERYYRVRQTPQ